MMMIGAFYSLQAREMQPDLPVDTGVTKVSDRPLFSGYVRGVAFGGTHDYPYALVFAEPAVKVSWMQNRLVMNMDVRVREGIFYNDHQTLLEVKQATAGFSSGKLDVTLGNQIVTWGKTDGFNPTNNITPTDHFFLTGDMDDQRMSNFLLQARIRPLRNTSLTLIGVPVFKPSVYRYELFDMGEGVSFVPPQKPDINFTNGAYAARLGVTLPFADFSLSWFDGFSNEYGFGIDSINLFPETRIRYRPEYYRKQAIGFDLVLPVRRTILRAEAAYNITSGYDKQMYVPHPDISYVAGVEREVAGTTVILQYIGKYTMDWSPLDEPVLLDPANPLAQMQYALEMIHHSSEDFNRQVFYQQEEMNHALSLSLVRSFAWDVVSAEISGYYNITSEESMACAAVTWKITDDLALSVGGSYLQGPDGTLFEKARNVMSGAYCSIRASF